MSERAEARIRVALERARADALEPYLPPQAGGAPRPRRVAIGDVRAPMDKVFRTLESHGLLGDDGRLAPDALLVSLGDHFDWGGEGERSRTTREALELLAWLASHAPDQVVLLLGERDVARVCELNELDVTGYDAERARSAVAQRALVRRLVESRRFRLGWAAAEDLLCAHAGVTHDDLARIGLSAGKRSDAREVALALNGFMDRVVEAWDGIERFDLQPLHQCPGAAGEEGRGVLIQRPAHPRRAPAEDFAGPPRRAFDPRALPGGLVQVVGHARDAECRRLLEGWIDTEAPEEGGLRHLITDGGRVRYGPGTPWNAPKETARMIFCQGGLYRASVERFELFDLDARAAAARVTRP